MAEENSSNSCPICREEFKTPKVLSCGHTFCLPCVNKIVDREESKPSLQCPICKVPVAFPNSGETEDLATNFQLMSVLRVTKQGGRGGLRESKSIEIEEEEVEVRGQSRCSVHRQENQLYCEFCKIPVCTKCIFQEHKVGEHNVITKEDFLADQMVQLEEIKTRLDMVEEVCLSVTKELTNHQSAYLDDRQKLEETIERNLKEKQEKLELSAKALLEQVKESSCKPEELYANLTAQLTLRQELIDNLQTGAKSLKADLEGTRFTRESDLEEIDKYINGLTPELAALGKACNTVPTKAGLTFTVSSSNTHLGSLTQSGSMPRRIKSKTAAWFHDKGTNQGPKPASNGMGQNTAQTPNGEQQAN